MRTNISRNDLVNTNVFVESSSSWKRSFIECFVSHCDKSTKNADEIHIEGGAILGCCTTRYYKAFQSTDPKRLFTTRSCYLDADDVREVARIKYEFWKKEHDKPGMLFYAFEDESGKLYLGPAGLPKIDKWTDKAYVEFKTDNMDFDKIHINLPDDFQKRFKSLGIIHTSFESALKSFIESLKIKAETESVNFKL